MKKQKERTHAATQNMISVDISILSIWLARSFLILATRLT